MKDSVGNVSRYTEQRDRSLHCKFDYIKRMIESNPGHSSSLFLAMTLLQDSVPRQKELFLQFAGEE